MSTGGGSPAKAVLPLSILENLENLGNFGKKSLP